MQTNIRLNSDTSCKDFILVKVWFGFITNTNSTEPLTAIVNVLPHSPDFLLGMRIRDMRSRHSNVAMTFSIPALGGVVSVQTICRSRRRGDLKMISRHR